MPIVLNPQILSVSRTAGAWSSWAAAPVGAVDPSASVLNMPALSTKWALEQMWACLGEMVKLVSFLSFVSNSWKLKPLTELSPLQTG